MVMPDRSKKTTCFNITLKHDQVKKVYDQNTMAKKLFEFLCSEKSLVTEEISLHTTTGLTLSAYPAADMQPLAQERDVFHIPNIGYKIIASSESKRLSEIDELQQTFSDFMSILCHNDYVREYIFRGLDALPVSIHLYDEKTQLIYANSDFCDYIQLKNRNEVYGMHIDDILKGTRVRFLSTKKSKDDLKVKDVLKYGKPVVDWEVEVKYAKTPEKNMLASNDMYPFFDETGSVTGAVEISRSRHKKVKELKNAMGLVAEYTFDDILGDSKPMLEAKHLAATFANSPYNVLIYGESGTGKELFAQSIHNHSERRNKSFVAINCATISPELIDSELFGYESGSFTGASKTGQIGKFELANGGTLFLDEVAELPLHFQTKLLRALETKEITRIGGSKSISVDVRIIAATNRSLEKMIDDGLFRRDLYYRLMVLNIMVPPLRKHREDILLYAEFFLAQTIQKNNLEEKVLDKKAKKLMLQYDWPGNIRQLRNVMNRVSILCKSNVITQETLSASLQLNPYNVNISSSIGKTPEMRLNEKKDAINRSYADLIQEALSISNGNKKQAAERLGISRKTFYRMLDKYGDFLS